MPDVKETQSAVPAQETAAPVEALSAPPKPAAKKPTKKK